MADNDPQAPGPQLPAAADTIVATSSPAGRSHRAIVRLSGPEAVQIASGVFTADEPICRLGSYTSTSGFVTIEPDQIRCPATAYVMLAPRSYTREDIVELHTFGAPPLLAALTDALAGGGARLAEPGEFTKRAVLNGRIDLTQAEAVQAVIRARSAAELRVSQSQLAGSLRDAAEKLRSGTRQLLAQIEASVDFVEQGIETIEPSNATAEIARLRAEAEALAGAEPAAPPKDGVATAICGLPNAGKSSLLNALAGHDRGIVTHLPGTTRDTGEHLVEVDGTAFRLIDTAGLGPTGHGPEAQAVERANAAAEAADLALLVIDGSQPLRAGARELWERLTARTGVGVIALINKSDRPCRISVPDKSRLAQRCPVVSISALRGDGLDDLRAEMVRMVRSDAVSCSAHPFWLTARHRSALRRAAQALGCAKAALADGLGLEFAAADLRDTLTAVGDIVGATPDDDILATIFSQFCVGK